VNQKTKWVLYEEKMEIERVENSLFLIFQITGIYN